MGKLREGGADHKLCTQLTNVSEEENEGGGRADTCQRTCFIGIGLHSQEVGRGRL